MTVMLLDADFGAKYVARVKGRIREVYLKGTTLDLKGDGETPQYILEAAGIGECRVDFTWQARPSDKIDVLYEFDSILAESYHDYMKGKFLKYRQLSTNDIPSMKILKEYIPCASFDGARMYAWKWNEELLKPEKTAVNWTKWIHNAEGFFTDIPEEEYFPTPFECVCSHKEELELVKF